MSKRSKVTPELIRRVKEIKDERPALTYKKISELLWLSRKSVNVSSETVGRILRDEYLIIDDKVVRVKAPFPGQIALVPQMKKVLEVVMHQTEEMSKENKHRKSLKEVSK